MKNSKLSIVAIVIFALTSIVSKAQDSPKLSDSKKQEMVEQMKLAQEKLKLSEDQKIKFKEISKNYAEKMKSLRATDEQRKAKLKQLKSIQEAKNRMKSDMERMGFTNEEISLYKAYKDLEKEVE